MFIFHSTMVRLVSCIDGWWVVSGSRAVTRSSQPSLLHGISVMAADADTLASASSPSHKFQKNGKITDAG